MNEVAGMSVQEYRRLPQGWTSIPTLKLDHETFMALREKVLEGLPMTEEEEATWDLFHVVMQD